MNSLEVMTNYNTNHIMQLSTSKNKVVLLRKKYFIMLLLLFDRNPALVMQWLPSIELTNDDKSSS